MCLWFYRSGTVEEIREKESTLRILVSALERGRNPTYSHRVTVPGYIHSASSDGASQQPAGWTQCSLADDHSWALVINSLYWHLGYPKEINPMAWTMGSQWWMIHEWAFVGSGCVERHLGSLARARGISHCVPHPGSRGTDNKKFDNPVDALAQVWALVTYPLVDTEDSVHRKSGHHNAWVGCLRMSDCSWNTVAWIMQ